MKNSKIITRAFLSSLAVLIYTSAVSYIMSYGNELFGKMETVFAFVAFLMLFVLSVAIIGLLVFLKPVLLYLDVKKQEAISLLVYTIGFIFIITLGFLLYLGIRG